MNKEIKAVFFDIDGTLVSFNTHRIPQSAKDAIVKLRQRGVTLIIATGRALCDLNNLEGLEFDAYITANGAFCVNNRRELISKNIIDKTNLLNLKEYQKEKPFPCIFMTEEGNFANFINDSVVEINNLVNLPIPQVKPMDEILELDVFQIDAFVRSDEETELFSRVLTDCQGSRWHPSFMDINVMNNSKSTGIDAVLKYYNIDIRHTMAFGDGGNDISMLQHVEVGIAMDNASENVKSVADYITSSVDDDGISKALEHYKLI